MIYRLFRRPSGSNEPFSSFDTWLQTDRRLAVLVADVAQRGNDRWSKHGAQGYEYRLFSVRVTDDQFIPVD